jgi:hypothetical protein
MSNPVSRAIVKNAWSLRPDHVDRSGAAIKAPISGVVKNSIAGRAYFSPRNFKIALTEDGTTGTSELTYRQKE